MEETPVTTQSHPPDPQQSNATSSTPTPPQLEQPIKRGRGRPRKYPRPLDYVSPVRKLTPSKSTFESASSYTSARIAPEEIVTSSGRSARSSRRNVDYAKLGNIEISSESDDDAVESTKSLTPTIGQFTRRRGRPPKDPTKGPRRPSKPKSDVVYIEGDDDDDEDVEEVDDEDDEYVADKEPQEEDDDADADNIIEGEDDESEYDLEEEDETPKRRKTARIQKSERKTAKKSKMALTFGGGKATRKTKDSVEGRMALFFGNRNAPLMEGIEYRNKWVNELSGLRQELLEDSIFPPADENQIDLSLQKLETAEEEKVRFFLPPREQELVFEIGMNEPLPKYSIKANESASLRDLTDGKREGFLLHTGGYVTGCQWAPLRDSNTQYVAVSIVSKIDEYAVSMFDRTAYDSVIQIWRMDLGQPTSSPARLALCLLHSWGTPWSLRWCPEAKSQSDSTIGCLAAAFQDGKVRVISVPVVNSLDVQYLTIDAPAKEITLPGMSITCVTWMTPHVVAVGCTNGFLATFDLSVVDELDDDDDDDDQPPPINVHASPVFCSPVHQSAILTLESAAPNYPHILTTTSADGYTRTLDTRDPRSSRAAAYRTKGYSSATTYVPSLNALITVEDSILTKITPILNLLTDIIFTRHEASVMCIASGKCHPFTATGGADGVVTVGNPIARSLVGKKLTYKDWPQTRLFKLEYSELERKFRFVEGYKVDVIGFNGKGGKGGYLIYPETVCVTSLSWNWRKETGGWIASGFANGLVRIENFCV
ncbi:uncharacterized protein V1513DRAFT_442928 [Lipomyces chichibuensis]|uniref:uncharacterized protein n=1 Tax=Lipomyces chichibuensis TaxID=1546026 RepID=UPI0033436ED0